MLVLTRPGATGAAIVERIERGALIELQLRPGAGVAVYECTLAGFDPANRYLLITTDGATIEAVPQVQVQGITVLGEDSRGAHVRNGLWIGGLSGLAIGAAVGAEMCSGNQYGSFCAVVLAIPVGGLGTGLGAGIGAIAASKRARTEYPLGPGGWWIGNRGPWQPAAPRTPVNIGGTP
jgi:hypothetical protein